jgi:hypothetical protein
MIIIKKQMKTLFCILSFCILSIFMFSCNTDLHITNNSQKDSVKVFLTLQEPQSVIGHFGIKAIDTTGTKSQGYFWAHQNITYKTNNGKKSFAGFVISFDTLNLDCEQAKKSGYTSGINIFEGSLNLEYESFDISCVDGANSCMKVSVDSKGWKTGEGTYTKNFTSAENAKILKDNYGIRGVFPYRCSNCINAPNPPKNCFKLPQKFNTKAICQTSRKNKRGGIVLLEYKGELK